MEQLVKAIELSSLDSLVDVLDENLVSFIAKTLEMEGATLRPVDILDSLTSIRHQTAVCEETGVPDEGTLRAMRVVLRQTPFEARLTFPDGSEVDDLPLLAACVLALRRAGVGRNRGRGRLQATIHDNREDSDGPGEDITPQQFGIFAQEVRQ